jgi:hypothetical protein
MLQSRVRAALSRLEAAFGVCRVQKCIRVIASDLPVVLDQLRINRSVPESSFPNGIAVRSMDFSEFTQQISMRRSKDSIWSIANFTDFKALGTRLRVGHLGPDGAHLRASTSVICGSFERRIRSLPVVVAVWVNQAGTVGRPFQWRMLSAFSLRKNDQ